MDRPKPLNIQQKLDEKLEEYGEAIANKDVKSYILHLVLKSKKKKPELLNALEVFFQEETDAFVSWLCTLSTEKLAKCRFFPNCLEENCAFFHPTEIVDFN